MGQSTSSRMRVINHNWSATKQRLHQHSVADPPTRMTSQHGDDDTRRDTRSIRDVAANICRTSMFGMECVADDVETWDCEAVGLVVIDMCFLKANDVNVMVLCQ